MAKKTEMKNVENRLTAKELLDFLNKINETNDLSTIRVEIGCEEYCSNNFERVNTIDFTCSFDYVNKTTSQKISIITTEV